MGIFNKGKEKFESSVFNEDFKQLLFKSISVGLLRGLVNIDGGHVGIATDWLTQCMDCDDSYFESTCKVCGRNSKNYVDFRSGRGDGVYPVIEISEQESDLDIGFLILFDFKVGLTSIGQIYSGLMNELQKVDSDNSALEDVFEELITAWDPIMHSYSQDLQIMEIAELELKQSKMLNHQKEITRLLVVGESGEGIDSDSALITVLNAPVGLYKVFLVGSRNPDNNNAFIPNLAIVLESSFSQKIGLTSDVVAKLNLSEEKTLWNGASVASYIGNPQNQVAMFSNYSYFNGLRIISEESGVEFETQKAIAFGAVCWLSMLNFLNPNDDVKGLIEGFINHYEIDIDEVNELRGQFNRKII